MPPSTRIFPCFNYCNFPLRQKHASESCAGLARQGPAFRGETSLTKLRRLLMAALAASSLTPFVAGGPAFADNQFAVVGNWSVTQHDSGTCSLKTTFDRGT